MASQSRRCITICVRVWSCSLITLILYREAEANKKAELAAKKAEREALLAAEEANAPSKVKSNPKAGSKKNSTPAKSTTVSRPLNLSSLDGDDDSRKAAPALNATGIDDALDALDLTATSGGGRGGGGDRVERHPERRFKAAFTAYEARRMPEVEKENPGLRRNQRVDLIRKEFEKSEENPFNQVHIGFDASKDEVREVRQMEREKTERRLAGK